MKETCFIHTVQYSNTLVIWGIRGPEDEGDIYAYIHVYNYTLVILWIGDQESREVKGDIYVYIHVYNYTLVIVGIGDRRRGRRMGHIYIHGRIWYS